MSSSSSGGLSTVRRRAMQAVGVTLVVWSLVVVAHHGEFWPFSTYPMFARAGQPWTSGLVLEVDPHAQRNWGPWTLDELPGVVYPAEIAGASAIDLSQIVKLTSDWTEERAEWVRKLFAPALSEGRTLMLVRADGSLTNAATVELTGIVLLKPDGNVWNPHLRGLQ